jgi:Fur family ferric uptake transcriptional regulator
MLQQPLIRPQDATRSHYLRQRAALSQPLGERLAARGVRLTSRRRALLKILEESDCHLDAAALLEAAQQQMEIDRATVYRTLDLFKREGLIDELDLMHLRGEMHYYEVRTSKEHFHLACFGCGRVEEIATPLFEQLKQEVSKEKGFTIQTARLEIGGYCAECGASTSQRRDSESSASVAFPPET